MDPTRPFLFVLLVILAPALTAGVCALLARRAPERMQSIGAVALGVGYAFGHAVSLGEIPGFPPSQSTHALFYLAIVATLAGAARGSSRVPSAIGWLVLALTAAAAPWAILRNLLARWSLIDAASTVFFVALGIAALTIALDAWAERRKGVAFPLVLWIATVAASVAVLLTESALYAQLAGCLAAVLGAAAVACVVVRQPTFARGPTLLCVVLLACFCLAGVYLSSLPRAAGLLLFYAPLAAVLVERSRLGHLPAPRLLAVQCGAVAAVAAIALLIAYRSQAGADAAY